MITTWFDLVTQMLSLFAHVHSAKPSRTLPTTPLLSHHQPFRKYLFRIAICFQILCFSYLRRMHEWFMLNRSLRQHCTRTKQCQARRWIGRPLVSFNRDWRPNLTPSSENPSYLHWQACLDSNARFSGFVFCFGQPLLFIKLKMWGGGVSGSVSWLVNCPLDVGTGASGTPRGHHFKVKRRSNLSSFVCMFGISPDRPPWCVMFFAARQEAI